LGRGRPPRLEEAQTKAFKHRGRKLDTGKEIFEKKRPGGKPFLITRKDGFKGEVGGSDLRKKVTPPNPRKSTGLKGQKPVSIGR